MSLELKTQTTKQIGWLYENGSDGTLEGTEKWVPFGDVQKVITLCEKRKEVVYRLEREKHDIEEQSRHNYDVSMAYLNQVREANKIIAKLCKECSEDNFGSCQNDCGINDLKTALNSKKETTKP